MSREDNPKAQIIVALIAAVAVIVSAYLALKAAREPVILAIEATQTAEAKLATDVAKHELENTEAISTEETPDSVVSAQNSETITSIVTSPPVTTNIQVTLATNSNAQIVSLNSTIDENFDENFEDEFWNVYGGMSFSRSSHSGDFAFHSVN